MNIELNEFYKLLNDEEFIFTQTLVKDDLGVYLRGAINELDWFNYNYSREQEKSHELNEYYYLLLIGTTRLIQLALDSRNAFDAPVVLFRRTKDRTRHILEIVAGLGVIEHGRRTAQFVEAGLATIRKDEDYRFTITITAAIRDDSYFETRVSEHFNSESKRIFELRSKTKQWKDMEEEVHRKIESLAFPFQKYFMGYDADPILDEFFFAKAYQDIQLKIGFDSFNGAVKFGRVSFQHYILSVTYIISIYRKHTKFAEIFSKIESDVHLENILTITSPTNEFVESIRDALNHFGQNIEGYIDIDLASAREIFEVISYSRNNTNILSAPGSPLPFLVQCSEQGVIQCLTGIDCEPIQYLLNSLRSKFPKEYDRNQRTREISLQKAIERILSESCQGLEFRENIKIKIDGNIATDIDFVIFEKHSGELILCQIKHQEYYGLDLNAKKIRTERLVKYSEKWLRTINYWLDNAEEAEIRSTLRISKDCPKLKIHKLILTKHYSYPLKDLVADYDTKYSNWLMFVNSVLLAQQSGNTIRLNEVLDSVVKSSTAYETPLHLDEPLTEWKLRKLIFSTESADHSD